MENINVTKRKAAKSAKWLVITSLITMCFSYLTNVILGRISPDTLGEFSKINLFLSSLTTFVGMGGAIILSNFIPKLKKNELKTCLFLSYSCISFLMYICLIIIFFKFPNVKALMGAEFPDTEKILAFGVMGPVFILMTLMTYFLTSILEARISNIMNKIYTVGLPIGIVSVCLIDEKALVNNLSYILLIIIILSNIVAIILGWHFIKSNMEWPKNGYYWYIPKGFTSFSITTFMQAILSYLYKNLDKMFLLQLGAIGQLGYYQAIISILAVVEFVPSLLGNVTIPYFSTIFMAGNKREVESSHEKIEKYMLLFLISCIIGVMSVSKEVLMVFGEEYMHYHYLLIILLISKGIVSLGFTNTPMLICLERNKLRLFNSLLQIFLQFSITFYLINKIGILAIVLGKTIGAICAQILPQFVLRYNCEYNISITRSYFVGNSLTTIYGCSILLTDWPFILKIFVGTICWILFVILGHYRKQDLRSIYATFIR